MLQQVGAIAEAVAACGFTGLTITADTADFTQCIATLTASQTALVIGASTVRTVAQARAAAAAGAVFISSTSVSTELIAATKVVGMYSLPGVSSTAEARSALACGADAVKFYPAARLGAVAAAELCTVLLHDTDVSGSNSAAAAAAVPIIAAGGLTPDMLTAFTAAGIAQLHIAYDMYSRAACLQCMISCSAEKSTAQQYKVILIISHKSLHLVFRRYTWHYIF
jgi:2-dehydro-3-deoxyphosphogalactonate aldolase